MAGAADEGPQTEGSDLEAGLVSVLVVTHDDLDLLERALTVFREMPGTEIVIANNDPTHDVTSWAAERFRNARVIEMGCEAGYARATNAAILRSRGEYVLFLDTDLFLPVDYVSIVRSFFDQHPRVGALGGKLLRYDLARDRETDIIDSAGVFLGRSRRAMARGEGEHDRGQYDSAAEVCGIDGAGICVRRTALESIAIDGEYFDASFYMYKEDTDLCWRLRLAGWEIWYVPEVTGFHGRTTRGLGTRSYLSALRRVHRNEGSKRSEVRFHSAKNQWLMLTKNEDWTNLLRDLPLILGRELAVLGYNAIFDPKALAAVREYLRLLRATLAKRRMIKRRQVVSAAEFRRWLGTRSARPRLPHPTSGA